MRFLTGAPTKSYYKDSRGSSYWESYYNTSTEVWNVVTGADNKNFVMTAMVPGAKVGENSTYTSLGLVRNHLYTILGAYSVKNTAGTVVAYLYRIRNPWA